MIRFYNALILRFSDGVRLDRGEVWTDGEKIVHVGEKKEAFAPFEREIDLAGKLIMPGFKNAHSHTAMTFFRSLADDMPLDKWLSEQIWPNESKLTGEAVYDFTKLGILEYLSSGITACFDMYIKNDYYAKACVDAGFRTVLCSGLNRFDKDPEDIEREYLKFNSYDPLVSYILGIHAEYTTPIERMEYMASLSEKYKAPCFTHLCETRAEVDGCKQRYGLTPPQLLDRLGFFEHGGGGFHCVWLDEADIALMAEKKLWAVTCPGSNAKLASGIAPIDALARAGVNLAIGTDGAGSNNALDMFREMYLVSVLQKLLCADAAAGSADRTLQMACVGSARAMGLDECDELAVGKRADMVVIDLERANMRPINNIARNLVYSGSKENVYMTVIDGKILYEAGQYYIDERAEDIYARCDEWKKRLTE